MNFIEEAAARIAPAHEAPAAVPARSSRQFSPATKSRPQVVAA